MGAEAAGGNDGHESAEHSSDQSGDGESGDSEDFGD